MKHTPSRNGFTLIEIMIVVAIVGLLASLALPNMLLAGQNTRAARFAREIKNTAHAFAQYSFEHGEYPADETPAQMPQGMSDYLDLQTWSSETVIGGYWDWDFKVFGITAGVSVKSPNWGDDQMQEIDVLLDDGNLTTGQFRIRPGGYIYILEN